MLHQTNYDVPMQIRHQALGIKGSQGNVQVQSMKKNIYQNDQMILINK